MIFAPQITSPEGESVFNLGTVDITWDNNSPASTNNVDTSTVTYEIEYTDSYRGEDTNWHVLKRRIPYETTSYVWVVGKMIKSKTVRIRMRAVSTQDESRSDYSISDEFSINVFDLLAPAVVSPISGFLYSDFIMVILDETLTRNTYHQKVRYTLDYSSEKRSISWTTIASDIPVGKNTIRWNIEDVPTSDDYILRVTAKNATSCLPGEEPESEQIARRFVYNIKIQQSGLFYIDTKPPEALLEIEGNSRVTNELDQIINIFAEDATTDVEQIQVRECNASTQLFLGDLEETESTTEETCPTIADILSGENVNFSRLIGKPINNNAKIQWNFEDISGTRKLEALLTDSGGNTSVQVDSKIFVSTYNADNIINDFAIIVEQRDKITIDDSTSPPTVIRDVGIFEVVYFVTNNGEVWVLEPFARQLFTLTGLNIRLIIEYNNNVLLFANDSSDLGYAYRNDTTEGTLLKSFTNSNSIPTAVAEFNDVLYIGFLNGELWSYNGYSFSQLSPPVSDPIHALDGDQRYLYIGYQNSTNILLYNGTSFFTNDLES